MEWRLRLTGCTLYFSLIIVKSLQLHGRKQIAELCKYCLVHVIVFLRCVFSLFFDSRKFGNFDLIPYTGLCGFMRIRIPQSFI